MGIDQWRAEQDWPLPDTTYVDYHLAGAGRANTADGDGELGIALRCAFLDGHVARLFAGCGIVAASDPDTEVREAAAKLMAVREVMEPTDG